MPHFLPEHLSLKLVEYSQKIIMRTAITKITPIRSKKGKSEVSRRAMVNAA
jgi:hypothetical protein